VIPPCPDLHHHTPSTPIVYPLCVWERDKNKLRNQQEQEEEEEDDDERT
jgi:hypothetical protein